MPFFAKRRVISLLGIVAGSAIGCASPLSPVEFLELQQAEARWASRSFESYAFEVRISYFFAPELNQWSRVEVVNGTVTRVVTIESGSQVGAEDRHYFPTVEQLFADIRQASRDAGVQDIDVEFDAALGYPTSIRFEPSGDIIDGGRSYELRNATALP